VCNIKKLNKLKSLSISLTSRIRDAAPLSAFIPQYVSKNGLTFSDLSERLDRVSSCASILELTETWSKSTGSSAGGSAAVDLEQVLTVSAANYCKQHTICPVCADRSQARRRARFDDSIRKQVSQVNDKKRFAYMVTYTVSDGPELGERLEHLKRSKREFRRMGQTRRKGRSRGESGKICAAISTIEIKRGKNSGLWHAHAHELVFTDVPLDYTVYDPIIMGKLKKKWGGWIPKDRLDAAAIKKVSFKNELRSVSAISAQWFSATGGDSIGIDVEPIRHVPKGARGKKRARYHKMSFEDSVTYQAKECLKYCSKPGDVSPRDAITIVDETYNKRMYATYGEFRGLSGNDYNDESGNDDETFVMVWNNDDREYGPPQPGKLRDYIDADAEHDTRSEAGKITGSYRRRRRSLIDGRSNYGLSLNRLLDDAKASYRAQIGGLWSLYRHRKSYSERGCDKYNPVFSLIGACIPGVDRRAVYHAAFYGDCGG
jgi:hypothetical protein